MLTVGLIVYVGSEKVTKLGRNDDPDSLVVRVMESPSGSERAGNVKV